MNFELSLPLIWLVIFDVIGAVSLVVFKKLRSLARKWYFWLFPFFAFISCLWSPNPLRGLLTAGILILIWLAGSIMVTLKDEILDADFRKSWLKVFLVSSVLICAWCIAQCILDLAGVSRENTLLCLGCTYRSFGFPHPNGFAIEPQFMGSLLLAPIFTALYLILKSQKLSEGRAVTKIVLYFIFTFTLFLIFSRGAIYGFIVGLVFFLAYALVAKKAWKKALAVIGVTALAFFASLGVQGWMADASPTDDTFLAGVAKSLNHLSLGIIDFRENVVKNTETGAENSTREGTEVVKNTKTEAEKSSFDGYVAESTEVRKELNKNAITIWAENPRTILTGVGLGGAGEKMHEKGLTGSPKEIIQNEYLTILAETGLIGAGILIFTIIITARELVKSKILNKLSKGLLLSLAAAFAVTLGFFSGLPNALHIYLLPVAIYASFLSKKGIA